MPNYDKNPDALVKDLQDDAELLNTSPTLKQQFEQIFNTSDSFAKHPTGSLKIKDFLEGSTDNLFGIQERCSDFRKSLDTTSLPRHTKASMEYHLLCKIKSDAKQAQLENTKWGRDRLNDGADSAIDAHQKKINKAYKDSKRTWLEFGKEILSMVNNIIAKHEKPLLKELHRPKDPSPPIPTAANVNFDYPNYPPPPIPTHITQGLSSVGVSNDSVKPVVMQATPTKQPVIEK